MPMTDVPLQLWSGVELNAPLNTNATFNATTTRLGFVFAVPKTGSIRKIWFRIPTVTTAQTVKVSLQTVDATTGAPTGTIGQSATITPTANTWFSPTLSSDRAVTLGEVLALVIEWDSTAGDITIQLAATANFGSNYYLTYASGAWTKLPASTNRGLSGMLEYSDGTTAPVLNWCPSSATSADFANNTSIRQMGMVFTPSVTRRVCAAGWMGRAGGDCNLNVYTWDGTTATLVASVALDKDLRGSTTINNNVAWFSSKLTFTAGVTYFVTVEPTTTTTCRVEYHDLPSTLARAAMPFGMGDIGYLVQRSSVGTWTLTTTSKSVFYFFYDGIDTGSGTSGQQRRIL